MTYFVNQRTERTEDDKCEGVAENELQNACQSHKEPTYEIESAAVQTSWSDPQRIEAYLFNMWDETDTVAAPPPPAPAHPINWQQRGLTLRFMPNKPLSVLFESEYGSPSVLVE